MASSNEQVLPEMGQYINNYLLEKVINCTENSAIVMASDVKNNKEVAIKFIKCLPNRNQRVNEEIKLMEEINCPYIVSASDVFDFSPFKCIVMPLATTDLHKINALRNQKHLSEEDVKEIMLRMCKAVQYLHNRNICHRDIKPDNILIVENNGNDEIKLCDLGYAKEMRNDEKGTEYLGTLPYAPPEMICGTPYDMSVDIWSLGVTMYTLLCGESPFPKSSIKAMRCCISSCSFFFPANLFKGISSEAKDLICHMMKKNPAARYTIDQCLAHPWFSNKPFTAIKICQPLMLSKSREMIPVF